jgi:PTS system ascorbate-specific IIA component
MNGIFIIAHAPLASALRQCVLHVFPDAGSALVALDVQADAAPEQTLEQARGLMRQLGTAQTLILTDLFGATPCNVASKLVDGCDSRLLTGVNLPMLLRAMSYLHEPLETLSGRAMMGASQGIVSVAGTAPQNQSRRTIHDQDQHDHQQ